MDFIAIDFETANNKKSSVCALGMVFVKNNVVVDKESYLIKPTPNEFQYEKHTEIHGITSKDVENSPTFDVLWEQIGPKLTNSLIVAQGAASADIAFLKKSLEHYSLPVPDFNYLCTYQISRTLLPFLPNHTLTTLCNYFNIDLPQHHNALCDAEAAANILLEFIHEFNVNSVEDFKLLCSPVNDVTSNRLQGKTVVFKGKPSLFSLGAYKSICKKFGATASEIFYENKTDYIVFAKHTYDKFLRGDYSEKMKKAMRLAEEGKLEILSEEAFLKLLGVSLTPTQKKSSNPSSKSSKPNIFVPPDEIDMLNPFFGKHFVITGSLERFDRSLAYQCIKYFGGFEDNGVTKESDYLIVGKFDSAHVTDGKSNKLKKAEEYNDRGTDIKIIDEYTFYEMLEEAQAPKTKTNLSINDADKILNIIKNRFSALFPGTDIRNYIQSKILKGEKAFSVVFLDNKLMMKFIFLKDCCRLLIGANYENVLPAELKPYTMPSYSGFVCIDAVNTDFLESLDAFYIKFYENCSSRDIGCCSRYEECSDAGHCVNNNIETVLSCAYRQNLNAGRIFYGKNKNI